MTLLDIARAALLLSAATFGLQVHAEILNLSAMLDPSQERLAEVDLDDATPNNAFGAATLSYDTDTRELSWEIGFSNLSGAVTAAHFHGPAGVGATAPPVITLTAGASPISGSETLTEAQAAELLDGLWYINLHTALNQPGEIRGQVFLNANTISLNAVLDTDQEVPAPDPATPEGAGGTAVMTLDTASRLFSWRVEFSGLSGNNGIIAAHFHGPAPVGGTAPPLIDIGEVGSLSPLVGSRLMAAPEIADLLSGLWYINLHTDLNRSGEVRGQIPALDTLIRFSATLDTDQEVTAPDPATPADAGGSARVLLDSATGLLTWEVEYQNLSGPLQAAHFHGPAPAGQDAAVIFAIGEADDPSPLVGTMVIPTEQRDQLRNGLWYINLHTELNQAGEVRGQVTDSNAVFDDDFEAGATVTLD